MSVKRALRKLSRAFSAKDEAMFDDAIGELEEKLEKDEAPEPETIEVHNHIPDSRDTAIGELPEKDPARDSEEEPEWFKKHREANDAAMKSMRDDFEDFIKKGKEGGEESAEDRRDRRNRDEEELPEEEEPRDNDPNLEMDRHRDSEEDPVDRRRSSNSDESNKEILGELEFEAPPGTGDRARKARDSRYLEDAFADTTSKAEILAPGIRLPTFDAKAAPARTLRAMHSLRKTALDLAYNQAETRGVISDAMSGRTLDSRRLSLANTRVLFSSVASAVAAGNNRRATDRSPSGGGGHQVTGARIQSIADINRFNAERRQK